MYSTTARRAPARVGQGWWSMHSPLSEAKNDSARALSQHCPVRPTESRTSRSSARVAYWVEVYWAAPVGVEDHAGVGVAGRDGVGQGVGDQVGAQVVGHRVADHTPGGDVDDGGQVEPPLPGVDVGDVLCRSLSYVDVPAAPGRRGSGVGSVAAGQTARAGWGRVRADAGPSS